jgi:hypothetical protein
MANDTVLRVQRLGFPWQPLDPFLFCVHHVDGYPRGNGKFGPATALTGRDLGQDFANVDGWNMYHGTTVPGFPQHPHRGFETVTIVRKGLIDHSDSLGARARFGQGDVQWLTAGKGIVHSEMFPLLETEKPNPAELFQIWLNLPAVNKMVEPHFSMLWAPKIPVVKRLDDAGRTTTVTVIAGALGSAAVLAPPPKSWASVPGSDVAIWTIELEPNAKWTMPAAQPGTNRMLFFFAGESMTVAGEQVPVKSSVQVRADREVTLENGPVTGEVLVLQGKPIGEPVASHGPFVMNTQRELQQAFQDYQRTQFGGWPWEADDPVHGAEPKRFARHVDGREEFAE